MFCLPDRAACSIWSFVRSLYQNHFDEDVDLSKIYRYLDKLNHTRQEKVQDISVRHTRELLGGNIGVMFYDVTTPVLRGRQGRRPAQDGLLKGGQAQKPSNHTWASGEPERLPAGLLHPRGEQIRGTHHDAGHQGVRPQV